MDTRPRATACSSVQFEILFNTRFSQVVPTYLHTAPTVTVIFQVNLN